MPSSSAFSPPPPHLLCTSSAFDAKPHTNSPNPPPQPPRLSRRLLLTAFTATTMTLLPLACNSEPASVSKTPDEWRAQLSPLAFRVLREGGTERPFSSALNSEYGPGVFQCAACQNPLFSSSAKFDSGTGWPSFFDPLEGGVKTVQSATDILFMQKEVRCSVCNGHLGHVFKDGPRPTGLRYCMNGVAMEFKSK